MTGSETADEDPVKPYASVAVPSLFTRIILSLLAASVVSGISLSAAWTTVSGQLRQHWQIEKDFYRLTNTVRFYREEHGRFPDTLPDLKEVYRDSYLPLTDPWGHPYAYEHADDRFLITTLGRDGQAGGRGLDVDLTTDDSCPRAVDLPLWQFLFDVEARAGIACSLLSGLLIGVLTFRELQFSRDRYGPRAVHQYRSRAMLVVGLGVWLFVSVQAAALLAMFHHIPNNH